MAYEAKKREGEVRMKKSLRYWIDGQITYALGIYLFVHDHNILALIFIVVGSTSQWIGGNMMDKED